MAPTLEGSGGGFEMRSFLVGGQLKGGAAPAVSDVREGNFI